MKFWISAKAPCGLLEQKNIRIRIAHHVLGHRRRSCLVLQFRFEKIITPSTVALLSFLLHRSFSGPQRNPYYNLRIKQVNSSLNSVYSPFHLYTYLHTFIQIYVYVSSCSQMLYLIPLVPVCDAIRFSV